MKIQRSPSQFWSVHTHSRYSVNDALPKVADIVKRVKEFNQPALALTDHGNMAGSIELYQACMKEGIAPFPGSEMYFVPDLNQYKADYKNKQKKAVRYHLGVVAYTTQGYENLVGLSTLSHKNHFHKPTLDYSLIAQYAEDGRTEGLAVTTGCYFGYLTQTLIHRGEAAAKQYLATLESWFPRSVYVEIQNHRIDHGDGATDDTVADALVRLAGEVGLPVVIGQDSHYVYESDRADHEALKRLVSWGPDTDDAVFPGDGFHLADDRWIRDHHSGSRLARGLEGLADLLSRHTLRIPVLDSYSYSVPQVVADPQKVMSERVTKAAEKLPKRYHAKLAEELEIIEDTGMAGYMMLCAQVTDWMRDEQILFQTRGSAAGSLVSWLLGISSVDPIKWDLRFERFLSRDRTKPPDVDLDLQHDRRGDLMEYLNSRFAAHQIGTWGEYSHDDEEEEEGEKGSLLVRYWSTRAKQEDYDKEDRTIPDSDMAMLKRLSERSLFKGMGTNAAGVVLTSTPLEFDRLVPLAYMARSGSRSGYVTQYSKDDIELLGLVKLDVLGSKTLTVMKGALELIGMSYEELQEVKYYDKNTYKVIGSGYTEGIFQLEGNTSKWGCKKLKPNNIADVIAAMALFRTAAMKSGGTDAYIRRKHRREETPERHEIINNITKPTYGVMLYQEQVIDLLRALGMEADDLTEFLKAVKASNKGIDKAAKVIQSYTSWIREACGRLGFDRDDIEFLDEAIAGFAEYGFNRAHATVYGLTAYRCAYLVSAYPLEFHTSLLAVASEGDKKKLNKYLHATRKRGYGVVAPDLNMSGSTYTLDKKRGMIRKGLVSIDGVGAITAERLAGAAPFRTLAELVERSAELGISGHKEFDGSKQSLTGILGKIRDAGLLDAYPDVRSTDQGKSNVVPLRPKTSRSAPQADAG